MNDLKPKITKLKFFSRSIRSNVAAGMKGRDVLNPNDAGNSDSRIRKIQNLNKLQRKEQNNGLLSFLFNTAGSFVGWIGTEAFKFISFSATAIFSWVFNTVERLKAFNWNATDQELQKMLDGSKNSLAAIWGSFIGQGIGWISGIALGYGVSMVLPVIGGAALARLIATKTAIEARDELLPSLFGAISSTLNIAATNTAISGYMNYRSLLKKAPRQLLEAVYGKDGADFIQKFWGQSGQPNLSFNQVVEESLESITDQTLRIFIDALLEEAWDSFIEAGFVVAAEIDNAYSQSRQASVQALGSDRSADLILNKQSSKPNQEVIRLQKLPQKQMISLIQQQISNYKVMQNRDVGMLVGLPLEEYAKAKEQSLRILIDLYSKKEPPFYRDTKDLVLASVAIPDVKRSMLDWATIKRLCGGENGYMWGRFRAVARLDNGRKLIIHAGSEEEAERQIKDYLQLTTAEMLTLNITEEKKAAQRLQRPKLAKNTTRIYPAYFTVINRKEILEPDKGRAGIKRNYRDARIRIPLWTEQPPPNYKDLIQDIFTTGY
jgi:hypothetical protein